MSIWHNLFPVQKPIIGMIHVQALPGTPSNFLPVDEIIEAAVKDALLYEKNGLDGMIIENMHDVPYLNRKVGPEITAVLTAVSNEIKRVIHLPVGLQILAGANQEALAVALAADLSFVRAEGYVFAHVADEGYMDSCAGALLRYRKSIGAEHIAILTDIKKKHSAHAITSDVSIGATAAAAEFFLSDGLIVTGAATGEVVDTDDLKQAKQASSLPVIIGSGMNIDNLAQFWPLADGFIVGSWFKEDNIWSNPLSEDRIRLFIQKASTLS